MSIHEAFHFADEISHPRFCVLQLIPETLIFSLQRLKWLFERLRLWEYSGDALLVLDSTRCVRVNNCLNVLTQLPLFGLHGLNESLELLVITLKLLELIFFCTNDLLLVLSIFLFLLMFISQLLNFLLLRVLNNFQRFRHLYLLGPVRER